MIRRFYVHNFRCLENFELTLRESSVLLIGKNGAGKTTLALALEILQKIARGTNRVSELVTPEDLTRGRADVPIRLEIEVELDRKIYKYSIAFEFAVDIAALRVAEEGLAVDGRPIYNRDVGQMAAGSAGSVPGTAFHSQVAALPIIQERSPSDPLFIFKRCLARMLILRPIPVLIGADSAQETLEPNPQVTDLAAWFSGIVAHSPARYFDVKEYLDPLIPDLKEIQNPLISKGSRSMTVQFSNEQGELNVPVDKLSDGEKCFMICAMAIAANRTYGPLLCFWDEPDNYLALDEVAQFVLALRRAFQSGGQFIATSHSPEAIRSFSNENTFLLYRKSHLEPTVVRRLEDIKVNGDLISALIRGDVEL